VFLFALLGLHNTRITNRCILTSRYFQPYD